MELQGAVDHYVLRTQGAALDTEEVLEAYLQNYLLENLIPNTAYVNRLTIVTHGGEIISSDLVTTLTQDGGE